MTWNSQKQKKSGHGTGDDLEKTALLQRVLRGFFDQEREEFHNLEKTAGTNQEAVLAKLQKLEELDASKTKTLDELTASTSATSTKMAAMETEMKTNNEQITAGLQKIETEMKEKITAMQTEVLIKQEANLKDLGEMLTTIICHKTNDIKGDTNALKHELLKELKSVRDSTLTAKISHFFSREVTEAAELNKDVLQADLEKLCSPPASAPDT